MVLTLYLTSVRLGSLLKDGQQGITYGYVCVRKSDIACEGLLATFLVYRQQPLIRIAAPECDGCLV